jgi:hypothetical protein
MFPSEASRQEYYLDLMTHANKLYKKPSARDIGLLHVMRLSKWCGEELERALMTLAHDATYRQDAEA